MNKRFDCLFQYFYMKMILEAIVISPCPFCGLTDHTRVVVDETDDYYIYMYVECGTCDAKGPTFAEPYHYLYNEKNIDSGKLKAIQCWNMRPMPQVRI